MKAKRVLAECCQGSRADGDLEEENYRVISLCPKKREMLLYVAPKKNEGGKRKENLYLRLRATHATSVKTLVLHSKSVRCCS